MFTLLHVAIRSKLQYTIKLIKNSRNFVYMSVQRPRVLFQRYFAICSYKSWPCSELYSVDIWHAVPQLHSLRGLRAFMREQYSLINFFNEKGKNTVKSEIVVVFAIDFQHSRNKIPKKKGRRGEVRGGAVLAIRN